MMVAGLELTKMTDSLFARPCSLGPDNRTHTPDDDDRRSDDQDALDVGALGTLSGSTAQWRRRPSSPVAAGAASAAASVVEPSTGASVVVRVAPDGLEPKTGRSRKRCPAANLEQRRVSGRTSAGSELSSPRSRGSGVDETAGSSPAPVIGTVVAELHFDGRAPREAEDLVPRQMPNTGSRSRGFFSWR